jgi:hypothetical protein
MPFGALLVAALALGSGLLLALTARKREPGLQESRVSCPTCGRSDGCGCRRRR